MCQMASGKLARIRLDAVSPRPHQMAYYSLQGTLGVYEANRISGQSGSIWFRGMDKDADEAKWRPLSDMSEYLPDRYKNAAEEQIKSGHGGGDFFIVEDFVNAALGKIPNPVDVYRACEWTAVALLSELSVTNGNRCMDMPHFRKNMPFEEQRIKL